MKHTIHAQEPYYSIDVQRIYDVTMELVKDSKFWKNRWEKVADWVQQETGKHKTFQEALKVVRRKMRKCGGD